VFIARKVTENIKVSLGLVMFQVVSANAHLFDLCNSKEKITYAGQEFVRQKLRHIRRAG